MMVISLFLLCNKAVDLAAVSTFLLEALPSMKSSNRESKETMPFTLYAYFFSSFFLQNDSLSSCYMIKDGFLGSTNFFFHWVS